MGLDGRTLVRYCTAMSNDRSYLALLQDYYARHRALPSYASIGQLLGLKSKSSVAAMVARLKLAGLPRIHARPAARADRPVLRAAAGRVAGAGGRAESRRGRAIPTR